MNSPFYNEECPPISLNWDNLETPAETLDGLSLSPPEERNDFFETEVPADE